MTTSQGRRLRRGVFALIAFALGHSAFAVPASATPRVIRVPQDAVTIRSAIDMAGPGDLILLGEGTYSGPVEVPRSKPGITIRGVDRNRVVVDGRDQIVRGFDIEADGVSLENLTIHDVTGNAVYWKSVHGFRGRYLTVYDVGSYGIYALDSTGGVLTHDLVSGAADSAFYIGQCRPCRTVLTGVTARFSAIGFSGTNSGGELNVRDSLFDRNGTGIMPNSYDDEANPPQRGIALTGNTVTGSGTVPTPSSDPLGGLTGLGIAIAGGSDDVVEGNRVTGSARYGIAIFPTVQGGGVRWVPRANAIRDNAVAGSGIGDLALAAGSGLGNCFASNVFAGSLPDRIEMAYPCSDPAAGVALATPGPQGPTTGDARVAKDLVIPTEVAAARVGPRPAYTSMPKPAPQITMPGAEDLLPSRAGGSPTGSGVSLWLLAAVALPAIAVGVGVVAVRQRRRRP